MKQINNLFDNFDDIPFAYLKVLKKLFTHKIMALLIETREFHINLLIIKPRSSGLSTKSRLSTLL